MTTIPTKEVVADKPGHKHTIIEWLGVNTVEDSSGSDAIELGACGPLASVQVTGTFGGGTVSLQGSNDYNTYFTLKSVSGDDIAFSSAGLVEFSTTVLSLRVTCVGGSGNDLDVIVVSRSN